MVSKTVTSSSRSSQMTTSSTISDHSYTTTGRKHVNLAKYSQISGLDTSSSGLRSYSADTRSRSYSVDREPSRIRSRSYSVDRKPVAASSYSHHYSNGYGSKASRSASVDRDIDRSLRDTNKYFRSVHADYNADDYASSSMPRSRHSMSMEREFSSDGTYRGHSRQSYSVTNMYPEKYDQSLYSSEVSGYGRALVDDDDYRCGYRYHTSLDSDYEDYDQEVVSRSRRSRVPRASSMSRMEVDRAEIERQVRRSHVQRSSSVSRYDDHESEIFYPRRSRHGYGEMVEDINEQQHTSRDISRFVLDPAKKFVPDDIKVVTLPSGQKAVTFTKVSQHGSGDQSQANDQIEKIIQHTQYLQDSMHSLEEFVRRNRSFFPEETAIYQNVRFFRLSAEQLRQIGESEDAEIYGVKIREKLVVPPGCEVASILKRHYSRAEEVEIEYSDRKNHHEYVEQEEEYDMQKTIRQQVEAEFEARDRARSKGDHSYNIKQTDRHMKQRDAYKQSHSNMSSDYIKSIYNNAGLDYDSIYSRRSSVERTSEGSDRDSNYTRGSTGSRRKKRFDAAPQFTAKLRAKKCLEGQTVRFNCSLSGLPMPQVTWYHGNKVKSEGGRYHLSNNYGLCSLEISNAQKEDSGLYTVRAANVEGEIACSAPLEVQVIDIGEFHMGTNKPVFVMEIKNTAAEIGDKAILEAFVVARPYPTFRWQKDNMNISQSERFRIFSDETGNARLVIRAIESSDAGLYFCIAENTEGKAKCAATLRVVEPGQLPEEYRRRSVSRETTPLSFRRRGSLDAGRLSERESVKGLKPWWIKCPPEEVKVHELEPLTLRCIVDGDPKPIITWYKGVRELQYSKRHRIVNDGNHYMMQIRSAVQTDPGEYTVEAVNKFGRLRASIWVSILPKREEEEEEYQRTPFDWPDIESEVSYKSGSSRMAPRFTKKLPREKEVKEGSSLVVDCKVEEADMPEYITDVNIRTKLVYHDDKKSDTKSNASDRKVEVINASECNGVATPVEQVPVTSSSVTEHAQKEAPPAPELVQNNIQPAEDKIHTEPAQEVEAPKTSEESPEQEQSVENVTVEIKSVAPTVAKALKDKTVKVGKMVKIGFLLNQCTPEPKVEWFKDGQPVDEDVAEPSQSGDAYYLEICDVELEEAGTYSATATNLAGSVSCQCVLTVEEEKPKYVAPSFTQSPVDQTVDEGATATFSCKVNGDPQPEVVWSKDGKDLASSETLVLTVEADCHTLTISKVTKADEGEYTCTASSIAGSGDCAATLTVNIVQEQTTEEVTAPVETSSDAASHTKSGTETGSASESADSESDSSTETGGSSSSSSSEEEALEEEEKQEQQEQQEQHTEEKEKETETVQELDEKTGYSDVFSNFVNKIGKYVTLEDPVINILNIITNQME